MEISRRAALKSGAALAAGTMMPRRMFAEHEPRQWSWIDGAPGDCPVDTVVMLFLENRSFDHMLGWLGSDAEYLEAGRRRYGSSFSVDATTKSRYRDRQGKRVDTYALVPSGESNPWRGCGHPIPAHGWSQGRVQLDEGFVAEGSGNDRYAISYYRKPDVPVYAQLARNYVVHDAHFSSLLGETLPNRQYIHAATSNGEKDNPAGGLKVGLWTQETIWDRLERAGVSARFYYSDFPYLLGFGERMSSRIWPIERFLEDCASGTLPHFAFVCPQFGARHQSDMHPRGDINLGQRFALAMFRAFSASPQWQRGMFLLAHDEWGGFWDHRRPERFPDERASNNLADDFGQAGFRVPSIMASPWVESGAVRSVPMDHTAHLRFLEWRFLGAPARGRGGRGWWLTERDRAAHNIGEALTRRRPRIDVPFDLEVPLPIPTPICGDEAATSRFDAAVAMQGDDGFDDYVALRHPPASTDAWVPSEDPRANPTKL